jgi:large subunit ribosomal protein L47
MEFFDVKKNWGETNIRTGRSWKLDELRLKSNTDLHKLW